MESRILCPSSTRSLRRTSGTFFSLSTILGVVDAEQLPGLPIEMGGLARAQIQAADIVVLNKVDLVSPDELAEVKQRVHEMTGDRGSSR